MSSSAIGESCQFFVQRKKRFCRMTVKNGNRYCGEHLGTATNEPEQQSANTKFKRVPCPIDSTHTCYETRLPRHLRVCNAKRLVDAQPSYVVKGINVGETDGGEPERVALARISQSLIDGIVERVEAAYERSQVIEEDISREEIVEEEITNEIYGRALKNHLRQNSSLLGHLKKAGLVRDNTCYVEFGAGKGKLAYWLARTISDKSRCSLLLVDRSSHRHKRDNKLRNEECCIDVSRIRADIADLRLSDVPEIKNTDNVVGMAKHLCGAATDLTIRCLSGLMRDEKKSRIAGAIIALCCHHRCEYSSYVGKDYLRSRGFVRDDFPILCSIASWATCATGKNRNAMVEEDEEKKKKIVERENVGRKVKALLDRGRIEYLRNLGFDSNLVYYTTREVSPENVCLIATLKKT